MMGLAAGEGVVTSDGSSGWRGGCNKLWIKRQVRGV